MASRISAVSIFVILISLTFPGLEMALPGGNRRLLAPAFPGFPGLETPGLPQFPNPSLPVLPSPDADPSFPNFPPVGTFPGSTPSFPFTPVFPPPQTESSP